MKKFLSLLALLVFSYFQSSASQVPDELMGHRFLTLNTVIRLNQIEVARDRNEGFDERHLHTPERVADFRKAVEEGFPGGRVTWSFSWLALHDTSENYRKIRELVVSYHHKYGDDITFIPGAYFANAYNTTEQVNRDLHDGLKIVSEMVGGGFRPKSVVAGFMSAKNLEYLAEKEGIHVCQGNIWSQFSIDNQDGDGAVSYPYYPSKEHFCKPAQGKEDFIDCVNLDGWTMDFLAARRNGFAEGYNSRMGVGPLETTNAYGKFLGLKEMIHTTAVHFDNGLEQNGFAWVTNCWEIPLPFDCSGLKDWLTEIRKRWPDTKFITQGEFGMLWREHYKDNSFDYRFEAKGSGVGGSDYNKKIKWFMNKDFRLAIIRDWQTRDPEFVIDFTRYDVKAEEPKEMTRKWSLMGEINQKQTRPQDKPRIIRELPSEWKNIIGKRYPELISRENTLMGNRFLTLNTMIRVKLIESTRDKSEGPDLSHMNTPERVKAYREAVEAGFPGAKITWSLTWLALNDTTANYRHIRELVASYHHKYGDDVTFAPGSYFANAYNSVEQVNKDLHDALALISKIVGNEYRPKSIVAGFLSAKNQQYLAEKEGIHVCQGNIWSQFSIDNQDGDGSVSYPFYPSKEHFCKPAQGKEDFIDCVNLDGWTMDFLAARRNGFADGYNSRMGVGPIETLLSFGKLTGLEQMMHTAEIHFDRGFELNGFAWITNNWEIDLPIDISGLTDWLRDIRRCWPNTKLVTQGEFGLLWREHYKDNNFNYRFESKGSGIGGSDYNKAIRWFMNKNFRMALLKDWQVPSSQEMVIDFTRYDVKAIEPKEMTRKWSLMGEINQKQSRPQDKPIPLKSLPEATKNMIRGVYPGLLPENQ